MSTLSDILREFTRSTNPNAQHDTTNYPDVDAMVAEIARLRSICKAILSLDEWQLEYANDDGEPTDASFCFSDEVKFYARQGVPKTEADA